MEILQIAQAIQDKIDQLGVGLKKIDEAATKKATTLALCDKHLAVTILTLRNGKELELNGEKVKDPAISLIDKIAKGICYEYLLEAELADNMYKAITTKLNVIMAQLNGYQSIFRHLETGTKNQ